MNEITGEQTASAAATVPAHPSDERWQPRYWSIFIGQGFSLVGSSLTQFVLLWWITDTTGSVAALATAGLAALLPHALLGPIGGTVADRYSRRALMIGADLVSALCMVVLIVLFLTDSIELWHAYVMMAVRSAMQAFQMPAATASTAMLVPERFIPRAAGLNQTLTGLILIGAAPLGALAISVMPIGWALSIDVFTAILGIVPLLIFRIPQDRRPNKLGFRRELAEGVQLVWRHPGLRRLYIVMAGITMVTMPTFTLIPLLVKEHFGGGAPEVAFVEAAAGIGMLLGGLVVTAVAPRRKILWCLGGFTFAHITIALLGLVPGDMLWLAAIWWTAGSILYVVGHAPLTALLQTQVANRLQGRVLSLLTTLEAMAAPIGLALVSPLGELIGIRWLFVVMGVLGTLIALSGLFSPTIRNIERSRIGIESELEGHRNGAASSSSAPSSPMSSARPGCCSLRRPRRRRLSNRLRRAWPSSLRRRAPR